MTAAPSPRGKPAASGVPTRLCRTCLTQKSETDFYRGHRTRCRACDRRAVRERAHRLKEADPEGWARRQRRYYIRNRYRVDPDWFLAQEAAQGGRCAICARRAKLALDHDHDSGRARGLICRSCNFGLGNFRDNPAALRAAASYVEQTHPRPLPTGRNRSSHPRDEPIDIPGGTP